MEALDARFVSFARLKIGSGKTAGYRMGTLEQLAALEARGEVLYRNDRYGNIYVVDRPGLEQAIGGGMMPVVHLGQMAGIEEVSARFPARWARVLLWCSRESAAERSQQRGDADTAARLAAWDATQADLAAHPQARWELRVDTDTTAPAEAAKTFHSPQSDRYLDTQILRRMAAASPTASAVLRRVMGIPAVP